MKKTNVYFSHSVSWSFKSLLTGLFLLVFMALANHGTAQTAPTPADVLPPLKSKTECTEIAQQEGAKVLDLMKQINDPNDSRIDGLRKLYNAYQFVINESAEPFFDMPLIMAQLYPEMHTTADGTTTHAYGFYAKSWNKDYTDIVNKFKK